MKHVVPILRAALAVTILSAVACGESNEGSSPANDALHGESWRNRLRVRHWRWDAAGPSLDAASSSDAGPPTPDSGPGDSGPLDSGPLDSGPLDSGSLDSGPHDSGPLDSGPLDSGPLDSGPLDSGSPDSGQVESGPAEAGGADSGGLDSGPTDAGPSDAGPTDSGPVDATPADTGTVDSGAAPPGPTIGDCRIFPSDNAWNRDISGDPVDSRSDAYVAFVNRGGDTTLKADFGSRIEYGLPFVVVPSAQPPVPIRFTEYGDESDPGPYPIPATAPVEGGNDHHVLVLQRGSCRLYEMYHARFNGSGWDCGSGAVFDLSSNATRPEGWTSTDQAGLPVLPGLVRYDEVSAGEIRHALRFTVWSPQAGWVPPATHPGSSSDSDAPPMGARFRLRASFDVSAYTGQSRVILEALKRYGMFVADTGTSWFVSGATDSRWNDTDLDQLRRIPGSAFEVVRIAEIRHY